MALLGLLPDIPKNVTLRMTAGEAQREAIGKAIGLIGTVIGAAGTVMALTANPAVQQQINGAYTQLPPDLQKNKMLTIIGVSAVGALALAWYISSSTKKHAAERWK